MDSKRPARRRRRGQWSWFPNYLLDKEYDTTTVAVYVVLARHASNHTQAAFPSQKRMARIIRVSERTIRRAIKTLEHDGLLRTYWHGRSFGYVLLDPGDPMDKDRLEKTVTRIRKRQTAMWFQTAHGRPDTTAPLDRRQRPTKYSKRSTNHTTFQSQRSPGAQSGPPETENDNDFSSASPPLFGAPADASDVTLGENELSPGDRVYHKAFGDGRVVNISSNIAEVKFEDRIRRLVLAVAPLERIF